MPDQIYLVPAPGLVVLDPVTYEELPSKGDFKPLNRYWRRRLRDKDVSQGRPPKAVTPAKED